MIQQGRIWKVGTTEASLANTNQQDKVAQDAIEVIYLESLSHFSFWVKKMDETSHKVKISQKGMQADDTEEPKPGSETLVEISTW